MSTTEDVIVETAVSHDALVAGAARDLVTKVMLEIDDILENGTPDRKMTILRAFATPLLRTANAQAENDEMSELREEVRKLHELILGTDEAPVVEQEAETLEGMESYDTAMDEPPVPG